MNYSKYDDIDFYYVDESTAMFSSYDDGYNDDDYIVEFSLFRRNKDDDEEDKKRRNDWINSALIGTGLAGLGIGGWYYRKPIMNAVRNLRNRGLAKSLQPPTTNEPKAQEEVLDQKPQVMQNPDLNQSNINIEETKPAAAENKSADIEETPKPSNPAESEPVKPKNDIEPEKPMPKNNNEQIEAPKVMEKPKLEPKVDRERLQYADQLYPNMAASNAGKKPQAPGSLQAGAKEPAPMNMQQQRQLMSPKQLANKGFYQIGENQLGQALDRNLRRYTADTMRLRWVENAANQPKPNPTPQSTKPSASSAERGFRQLSLDLGIEDAAMRDQIAGNLSRVWAQNRNIPLPKPGNSPIKPPADVDSRRFYQLTLEDAMRDQVAGNLPKVWAQNRNASILPKSGNDASASGNKSSLVNAVADWLFGRITRRKP